MEELIRFQTGKYNFQGLKAISICITIFLLVCASEIHGTTRGSRASQTKVLSGPKEKSSDRLLPATIKYFSISSNIRYHFCRTNATWRVVNANSNISQEINICMRIPKEAFISSFVIRSNGKTYTARVVEKGKASSMYKQSKSSGNTAGVVHMDDNNSKIFNMSLNVEASSEVFVTLLYDEMILRENYSYEYSIYMNTQQMMNIERFDLAVDVQEFHSIEYISAKWTNGNQSIELPESKKTLRGYRASIFWKPLQDIKYDTATSFGAVTINYDTEPNSRHGEVLLRDGYFVHTFIAKDLPILPKHVIFVLDISGSMIPTRLTALQNAMRNILHQLRAEDYFNIITFSSSVENWSPFQGKCSIIPFTASAEYKTEAVKFIDEISVHGSTNIHDAIMEALKLARKFSPGKFKKVITSAATRNCPFPRDYHQSDVTSMILFLTDGEPTSGIIDHRVILENVQSLNQKQKPQLPIFSLAFGSEADYRFVRVLSLQNRGFARKVYEGLRTSAKMENFFAEIASPVLSNVSFLYTAPEYNISNVTFSYYSVINKNEAIVVTGKISPKYLHTMNISSGNSSDTVCKFEVETISSPVPLDFQTICYCNSAGNGTITSEFISKDSEYDPLKKCDENEKDGFYMERRLAYMEIMDLIRQDTSASTNYTTKNASKIIEMAIKYEFVTPYTSLFVEKPAKNNGIISESIDVDGEEDVLYNNKQAAVIAPQTPATTVTVTMLSGRTGPARNLNGKTSRNVTYYKLADITWKDDHKNISYTNNKKETFLYFLYTSPQVSLYNESCIIKHRGSSGTCQHLKNCVIQEILQDYNLFRRSYFCPLIKKGRFIGMCCPI